MNDSNLKIATWNVNSIKARLALVLDWLEKEKPDILLMQELKGLEFPETAFQQAGYKTRAVCQKAYNGVAIAAKSDIEVMNEKLPGYGEEEPARYIEADINGIRVINIYAPNGNPWPGEKFDYKLEWLERLYRHLKYLRRNRVPFLVGGDFNIIPEERDCYDPELWENDALFRIESRKKFRSLLNLGLQDAFRLFNDESKQYTFWDYQGGAFRLNRGIRIDHFLSSPKITDRLVSCYIDREPRQLEKPSDHTPLVTEIGIV
jgi:exodeoxyribonuclease-3